MLPISPLSHLHPLQIPSAISIPPSMALPLVLPRTVMQHPIPKLESTTPAASTAAPTCTHTFDTWRNFAVTYAAQRNVSGKYGVDFRFAPEPSGGERRTLRLLDTAAKCLGPRILKRSAVQFDFVRVICCFSSERTEPNSAHRSRKTLTRALSRPRTFILTRQSPRRPRQRHVHPQSRSVLKRDSHSTNITRTRCTTYSSTLTSHLLLKRPHRPTRMASKTTIQKARTRRVRGS